MTMTVPPLFLAGNPPSTIRSPCGHERHVGTCPFCQRVQLRRWKAQLIEASRSARER
jgi:hypothetical protein